MTTKCASGHVGLAARPHAPPAQSSRVALALFGTRRDSPPQSGLSNASEVATALPIPLRPKAERSGEAAELSASPSGWVLRAAPVAARGSATNGRNTAQILGFLGLGSFYRSCANKRADHFPSHHNRVRGRAAQIERLPSGWMLRQADHAFVFGSIEAYLGFSERCGAKNVAAKRRPQ